jgi:autophagy-related protein 9
MMASNLLSRLLPSASDEPFDREQLDAPNRRTSSSTDERPDMDIDEENLGARFEAQDLNDLLAEASSSHMNTESRAVSPEARRNAPPGINTAARAPAWRQPAPARAVLLDDDDDVPQSLLLEGGLDPPPNPQPRPTASRTRPFNPTRTSTMGHNQATTTATRR